MEREQILERYADVLAAESTKEAFVLDGALYYRLDGEEEPGSRGEIVPLGRYYKAQKNGEKVK